MRRSLPIVVLILVFSMLAVLIWVSNSLDRVTPKVQMKKPREVGMSKSQAPPEAPASPTASESLLAGYGDVSTPPIEDLRKVQRVATGYFSLVKEATRFPIGGNEDFSAALRGENPNGEVFVRQDHPVFSKEGLLLDRWGTPLVVHPQAWRQLELRSAGPDRMPNNADDIVLSPSGNTIEVK